MRRLIYIFIAAVFIGLPVYAEQTSPIPTFKHDTITITTHNGQSFPFAVEIAITEQQRLYGLKKRTNLDANSGMLFLLPHEQPIAMWMEDTLIPLDMLFTNRQGVIVYIATDTIPESRTIIKSPTAAFAVVELAAGTAKKYGIATGDKILHSAFD